MLVVLSVFFTFAASSVVMPEVCAGSFTLGGVQWRLDDFAGTVVRGTSFFDNAGVVLSICGNLTAFPNCYSSDSACLLSSPFAQSLGNGESTAASLIQADNPSLGLTLTMGDGSECYPVPRSEVSWPRTIVLSLVCDPTANKIPSNVTFFTSFPCTYQATLFSPLFCPGQ